MRTAELASARPVGGAAAAVTLLRGGVFGSRCAERVLGGLPLTFLLSTVGFAVAFPLAVALALGRRSGQPARACASLTSTRARRSAGHVSVHGRRDVPVVRAAGLTVDKLLRAQIAFVMVIAAYVEVIRGGLQAIPKANTRPQPASASDTGHRRC